MMLVLQTNDGKDMKVNLDDIIVSKLIRTMVDCMVDSTDTIEIPLPNVSQKVLLKVLEFTKHYKENPMKQLMKPLPSDDLSQVVDVWYVEFISGLEEDMLYEVISASNYMDIEPIQELGCARIASLIRGKEPNEIRKILGINAE